MLGTTQESQKQWDQFVKNSIKKEKKDLEAVKEQSKKNKKENIETLEKHFHDRTIQPISEFKKVGEKEVGCSSGFQAEHQYGESDKATFMIKSVLNHTLTEEEKQSKLEQFKKSFYKMAKKLIKLQNPELSDTKIDLGVDDNWLRLKCNICYDNLNVADFICEYVTGDLYKLLLHDRAPVIELVTNNNLPRKRFANGNDLFKECIEQEKNQEQLHLRSKFLDKFATLMSLKEKGENCQDAKGFEKILAAHTNSHYVKNR